MGFSRTIVLLSVAMVMSYVCSAQQKSSEPGPIRSSPAYAEILLRKTELQADLEALTPDYTEESNKIIDLRSEIASLDKSLERVFSIRPSETDKLTLALGKLIVQKAVLETELARLLRSYNKDHKDVKRAARRVEIFDAAIREILR